LTETILFLQGTLILFEQSLIISIEKYIGGIAVNGYMKISDAAKKWEISERRVNTLCLQGRIPNAAKFGTTWAIPVDAERPRDQRITTGKYIKKL